MERITLPATQKGYFSQYFWGFLWLLAFVWAASWCSEYIATIYKTLGVDSWSGFEKLSWSKYKYWMMYPLPLLHIGMYVSYIISGIIILVNLYTVVYSTREVNTFSKSEAGYWNKVSSEIYGFPFSKITKQAVFDRITDIAVEQSGVNRILNTGTLKVKMITFTNADSKEQEWFVPSIKNPYERKAELEAALLGHEGLKVRLLQERE